MPHFTVTTLESDQLAAVWPLVRTAVPGLAPAGWTEFAEALIERGGGIVAVAAEDGAFHGIATYEPAEKLGLGKVLKVETLVAFELSRRAPVRRLLCEALDRLAALLGCTAVAVSTTNRGFAAHMARKAQGLADPRELLDEVVFLRPLGEAPLAHA